MFEYINFTHVGLGLLALTISRPVAILSISWFINRFKKKPIPLPHQLAVTYCGLRGAIAFYMVLNMTFFYQVSILS